MNIFNIISNKNLERALEEMNMEALARNTLLIASLAAMEIYNQKLLKETAESVSTLRELPNLSDVDIDHIKGNF